MANYEVNGPREILQGLLSEKDALAKLIEGILNQVLEAQMSEHLKAKPYERSDERQGYRNGSRIRTLTTRVGPLTLVVPQSRDGSFSSEIFKRYQRSEQAFVLALMEMVIQGVSTRKVKAITEELCGHSFSRTTVSRLTAGLDSQVQAFAHRTLEANYPFLMLDAMFLKVRENDQVVSKALLMAIGINADGFREVLGLSLGDSESFITWDELLKSLKARGLKGVAYVISDQHTGLARAIQRNLQGTVWQSLPRSACIRGCQVHLMRNVLGYTPTKAKAEVSEALKRIFLAPDLQEARRQVDQVQERLQQIAPKAWDCLEDGLEDALAIVALPEKYRKRLRSTNMLERLNEEVRRRERVIRIFPNPDAAIRLLGAILAETHETWQETKTFDLQDFYAWLDDKHLNPDDDNTIRLRP